MNFEFLNKQAFKSYLPKLINLYKICFGNRGLDENTFLWRYLDNPVDELLFLVAKDGDEIIASYSASPCLIVYQGVTYKTAISLNTMTHPNHQGKGLLVTLAKKLYDYMEQNNYLMIWGFPNNLSHRTFVDKLGWKTIYEVPTLTLDINKINYHFEMDSLVIDSSFKEDYQNFEFNQINNVVVKKDKNYLKWRYTDNPDNDYKTFALINNSKVEAYIVVKEYNNLLNIIELNYIDYNYAEYMINNMISYGKKIQKEKITIWTPINTKLHSYLEKIGFYNDYPIRYLGGKILGSNGGFEELLNYNNWFMHAGDNNEY